MIWKRIKGQYCKKSIFPQKLISFFVKTFCSCSLKCERWYINRKIPNFLRGKNLKDKQNLQILIVFTPHNFLHLNWINLHIINVQDINDVHKAVLNRPNQVFSFAFNMSKLMKSSHELLKNAAADLEVDSLLSVNSCKISRNLFKRKKSFQSRSRQS